MIKDPSSCNSEKTPTSESADKKLSKLIIPKIKASSANPTNDYFPSLNKKSSVELQTKP